MRTPLQVFGVTVLSFFGVAWASFFLTLALWGFGYYLLSPLLALVTMILISRAADLSDKPAWLEAFTMAFGGYLGLCLAVGTYVASASEDPWGLFTGFVFVFYFGPHIVAATVLSGFAVPLVKRGTLSTPNPGE